MPDYSEKPAEQMLNAMHLIDQELAREVFENRLKRERETSTASGIPVILLGTLSVTAYAAISAGTYALFGPAGAIGWISGSSFAIISLIVWKG